MIRCITIVMALAAVACSNGSAPETQQTQQAVENSYTPIEGRQGAAPTADEIRAAKPELAALVDSVEPRKTRAGFDRIALAELDVPEAAPLLIERLQRGQGRSEERAALAAALSRTSGSYAAQVVELIEAEGDTTVRSALVGSLQLAVEPAALEGLKLGLRDSAESIRELAAQTIGRRADGKALSSELIEALGDSSFRVKSSSARALGILEVPEAFDAIESLVGSGDPDLRLEALRALGRIDAERASTLAELSTLENDDDERIRTAAAKVRAMAY